MCHSPAEKRASLVSNSFLQNETASPRFCEQHSREEQEEFPSSLQSGQVHRLMTCDNHDVRNTPHDVYTPLENFHQTEFVEMSESLCEPSVPSAPSTDRQSTNWQWDAIFFGVIQNAFFVMQKTKVIFRIQNDFCGIQKFVLDIFGGQRGLINYKIVLELWKVKSGQGGVQLSANQKAAAKAAESSSTQNRKSNTKQQQKQQKNRKHKHNRSRQVPHTTKSTKQRTKSNKSSTNILEGQKRQGCVFHTTNNRSKEAQNKLRPRGVWRGVVGEGGRSVFPWKFGGNLLRSKGSNQL